MTKRISVMKARAELSALLEEVAHGDQRVLIERRGRPVAALVSVADLEVLEQDSTDSQARPQGTAALVGSWEDMANKNLDSLLKKLYASERESRLTGLVGETWVEE